LKEALFLGTPIALAILAAFIPVEVPSILWLDRLLGSLLGLLFGGGILWFFRVAGTLWFGREAMGMGDAHLMAGVGAVIGAKLIIIAFVGGAFLALFWAIFRLIMRKPHVLPFGPWLSIASILALIVGNPLIDAYLRLVLPPPLPLP
jgi:leader peptidase (prepilin peptidase) / N-methyltransferase